MSPCEYCHKPILEISLAHYNRRDPSRKFCSKHCFYADYLSQSPETPFEQQVLWPVLADLQLPRNQTVDLLCCYDDLVLYLSQVPPHQVDLRYWRLIENQYHMDQLDFVLVALIQTLAGSQRELIR